MCKRYHSSELHFTAQCCSRGLCHRWGKDELQFLYVSPKKQALPRTQNQGHLLLGVTMTKGLGGT